MKRFMIAAATLTILWTTSHLAAADWVLLGKRSASHSADKDTISCVFDGPVRALKFKVKRGAIHISRIVVHFGDGGELPIRVDANIPRGGSSPVLDLPGKRRRVTKVVFFYHTLKRSKKRAKVSLWGRR